VTADHFWPPRAVGTLALAFLAALEAGAASVHDGARAAITAEDPATGLGGLQGGFGAGADHLALGLGDDDLVSLGHIGGDAMRMGSHRHGTVHSERTSSDCLQPAARFVAAWRHDFGPKEASVLNRMVLLYAVPLALFVGTVGTPRADLVQDIAFVVAIFVAIVGLYALVFLLFRLVFRFSLSESVLAALIASAPAVPFMGPAIPGDLFGKASAVTVAIAALIINLIVVPITVLGLALGRTPIEATASPTTRNSAFAKKLVETVKEPIVWAPVLGFVLVLCDVRIPSIFGHGLSLLGQASGGVALFASGIMLAAYKIKIDWTHYSWCC